MKDMVDAVNDDTELLLRRIDGGKLLRIGLTNRDVKPLLRNPKAYCFVDEYRDAKDIVAACMLSSFIPGATGLMSGASPTIERSSARLREMTDLGFVKKQNGAGGEISTVLPSTTADSEGDKDASFPQFLDGGLCNGFPIIDEHTVLVTPIRGKFKPNRWICPSAEEETYHLTDQADTDDDDLVVLSKRVKLYMDRQNARTFRRIILSSDDSELQRRFSQGYDDAKRFLRDQNLETIHTSFVQNIG